MHLNYHLQISRIAYALSSRAVIGLLQISLSSAHWLSTFRNPVDAHNVYVQTINRELIKHAD